MAGSLDALIAETRELRTLPATAVRILDLIRDPTASASVVLAVIDKDASLTANLLKLANSAWFGSSRAVGTVHEALVLLGNRTVLNLAFAAGMGPMLSGPLASYRMQSRDLWRHSLAVALAAAYLVRASAADRSLRDVAFTAGLVHDIGKLMLNGPLKQELEQFPPEATAETMLSLEKEILGFDHAEAGSSLAAAWNFPERLVNVIGSHHFSADSSIEVDRKLLCAVAVADRVAGHLGFGGGSTPVAEEDFQDEVHRLGYGADTISELLLRLPGDLDALQSHLSA